MKNRDLKNLLNRGAAALETPQDLNEQERKDLAEDLTAAAKGLEAVDGQGNVDLWYDNSIQFPRLLAEIVATQDKLDLPALAESMDVTVEEINELLDRAQREWEVIKIENT